MTTSTKMMTDTTRQAIASLFLLLATSSVHAETVFRHGDGFVVVAYSPGGMVSQFVRERARFDLSHIKIRITGACMSACTIFTGADDVCITPDAALYFHQGTSDTATETMRQMWSKPVRDFVENYGAKLPTMKSGEWIVLNGDQAISDDIMKRCEP